MPPGWSPAALAGPTVSTIVIRTRAAVTRSLRLMTSSPMLILRTRSHSTSRSGLMQTPTQVNHQAEVILHVPRDQEPVAGILLGLPAHARHELRFVQEPLGVPRY